MKKNSFIHGVFFIKKNRGFTLLEIIISLVLLVIVLGVIFSFNLFGLRVFSKGDKLAGVQFDMRMVSDFIFSEVRNSAEISLTAPSSPNEYDKIFFEDNKIKYLPAGGSVITKTDTIFSNSTDVKFSIVQSGSSYMLKIDLIGTDDTNSYSLDTDILLNNVRTAVLTTNAQTIYYKKADISTTAASEPSMSSTTATETTIPTTTTTTAPSETNAPLNAEIEIATMTTSSVKIIFNYLIDTIVVSGTSNFNVEADDLDGKILILSMNSGNASNNTNYVFDVIDQNGTVKVVTVHYKNSSLKWDVVQLTDP